MNTTKIYFIRHGESEGNMRNTFLGHADLDLSPLGHEQAKLTAKYLKNIPCDAIYSSDLKRAYNTALETANLKGMQIIKSRNLREIFAGKWENQMFSDLEKNFNDTYKVWLENIGRACCDEGESVEELQNRFVSEVIKIAKENTGKTVFIFTHATPIRVLKAKCDNVSLDEIKNISWATNASVTIAEYKEEKLHIVEYSKDDFLGDMITALPDNV